MRNYSENTWANALRDPLVLGVSITGALLLAFMVISIQLFTGGTQVGNIAAGVAAISGYVLLRLFARYGKVGWEESLLWHLEIFLNKNKLPELVISPSSIEMHAIDTLTEDAIIYSKEEIREEIESVNTKDSFHLYIKVSSAGASVFETFPVSNKVSLKSGLNELSGGLLDDSFTIYSLYHLPYSTNPLWIHAELKKINDCLVFIRIDGLDKFQVKRQIERSRRNHAQSQETLSSIDSEVSFGEASMLLDGISRGEETVVRLSLVIASKTKLDLNPYYWTEEKNKKLAISAINGFRRRTFRSFNIRSTTASDLIPNFFDPRGSGHAILKTPRGNDLYFSPLDARLEALHWLVVGASGSGKSFFTGLILKRLVETENISVLFLDHNRSFRRMVKATGDYLEPQSLEELKSYSISKLNILGNIQGIELSDLPISEKKKAAKFVLEDLEKFLRARNSTHPIFVVIDECWNFLRDEPILVQRAFREYRKLNGAVIAITQSLGDFLSTENGQSILQNAPIRILLRQGEDVLPHQNALNLNEVEVKRVKLLKQVRGEYGECLIKTPYLSRIARLYPNEVEHDLLRTDNIRAELITEAKTRSEAHQ